MLYVCTVWGCPNTSDTKGIRFYRYPSDKKLLECWKKAMNCDFVPDKHYRICSAHFTVDDFVPAHGKKKRRMLKDDAIPSIFPKAAIYRFPGDTSSDETSSDDDEPNTSGSFPRLRNRSSNLINLTVKTLDAQDHQFKVPEVFTVLQLKLHIADRVSIAVNKQRLIFCGRVLSNETKLVDIGVDGKVLHLAQKVPNFTKTTPSTSTYTNEPRQNEDTTSYLPDDLISEDEEILPNDNSAPMFLRELPRPDGSVFSNERLQTALINIERGNEVLSRLENAQIINGSSTNYNEQFPQGSSQQAEDTSRNSLPDSGLMNHVLSHLQPNNSILPSPNSCQQSVESEGAHLPEITKAEPTNESSTEQNTRSLPSSATSEQISRNDSQTQENRFDAANNNRRQFKVVIEQLCKLNGRLQPFFSLFCQYVNVDPQFESTEGENGSQRAQSIYNGVAEVLHYVSHTLHLISDLRIDFDTPPPRSFESSPHIFYNNIIRLFNNSPELPPPSATSTQTTTENQPTSDSFGIAVLITNRIPERARNETSNVLTSDTNTSSNLNINTENSNASADPIGEGISRLYRETDSISTYSSEPSQSTTDSQLSSDIETPNNIPITENWMNQMVDVIEEISSGVERMPEMPMDGTNIPNTRTTGSAPILDLDQSIQQWTTERRDNPFFFCPFLPCRSHHFESTSANNDNQRPAEVPSVQEVEVDVDRASQGQSSSSLDLGNEENISNSTLPSPKFDNEPLPEVSVGDQEQHHGVPSELVPVTARDKRRHPATEPTCGDANLSVMPNKHRKILTSSKSQGPLPETIANNLEVAMDAGGVNINKEVSANVGADAAVQNAYTERIRTSPKSNKEKQPDFCPEH